MRIPRLVLVTDRTATGGRALVDVVRAALDAGLPAVQLRDKDLPARALFELAEALRTATTQAGALLLVNDRLDVALAVGADGVHLGGGSMPPAVARTMLGADALLGVSTHAPGEAAPEADFAFFGAVYATPGKTAQGVFSLRAAVAAASCPVLAIGGVTTARVAEVSAAGAAGVAVIRAVLAAPDPAAATHELLDALG